ncbi:11866_t:CDS:2 [Funneliformis mosseae]|uniref:11866_t:CDS:1 n=1 Tax=Funneliformis mosseae TaxID=27381 RepID=A0A9N9GZI6_FUNMO|nr:11866_t:CDS:2 [Funneliformis mosseae]
MCKYYRHLQKTNNNMKLLHQNDVSARTPSENYEMFSISFYLIEEIY